MKLTIMKNTNDSSDSKYVQKLSHYETEIYRDEFISWTQQITQGKPLQSEVAGLLLGRATPVLVNAKCRSCGKDILVSEQVEDSYDNVSSVLYHHDMHQKCFDLRKG